MTMISNSVNAFFPAERITPTILVSISEIEYLTTFIRAPKLKTLSNKVDIIGLYHDEPVLIRNSLHMVSSFHPEMSSSSIVHDYFISMINKRILSNTNKSKLNKSYLLK